MESAIDKVKASARRISSARKVDALTRVYHDLGIAGDDAWEFLEEVTAGTNVNFSGFAFSRFFPDETQALGEHVAKALGWRSRREPLTIQHLASVVELGVWFDPILNV